MLKAVSEGKPTLFFSTNDRDKLWRTKEKFTAVIEASLQDLGDLYTYSSINMPNVIGDLEELDVAFSRIDNPKEIFQFIQIRDRNQTEGRPWLQQIIGQQRSLGIDAGIAVSTKKFSKYAINIAPKFNIKLRLMHPETTTEIKKWFKPDSIGLHKPVSKIEMCSVLIGSENKIIELKADKEKVNENNVFVPMSDKKEYQLISLNRVFNADVLRNKKHCDSLFEKIPFDLNFHKATVAIEYKEPRLFVSLNQNSKKNLNINEKLSPIRAIVFFVYVSNHALEAVIKHQYKYIDATNGSVLAHMIAGEVNISNEINYISLVRHSCNQEFYKIGGAFFQ